jgi:hypothetical protein
MPRWDVALDYLAFATTPSTLQMQQFDQLARLPLQSETAARLKRARRIPSKERAFRCSPTLPAAPAARQAPEGEKSAGSRGTFPEASAAGMRPKGVSTYARLAYIALPSSGNLPKV